MTGTGPARCFVCGARDWLASRDRARCSHCGVNVDPARYHAPAHAARLAEMLRSGALDMRAAGCGPDDPFVMDIYTLRIAASAVPLAVEPADAAQAVALAHPHGPPARAWLRAMPPPASPALPHAFGLGGIARAGAAAGLAERLLALAGPRVPVAVVVDGAGLEPAPDARLRIVRRPLAGDFGAQRGAVQDALAAMGARWALQLDDDEALDAADIDALRALAGQAERHGTVSIGLRRLNLVDGERSDLWPDVQYRLNRTHVRYRGRVHERPDAGGWRRTTIALRGTIEHRLERDRVTARSAGYGAMEAGAERSGDEAALLRPFAP